MDRNEKKNQYNTVYWNHERNNVNVMKPGQILVRNRASIVKRSIYPNNISSNYVSKSIPIVTTNN